MMPPETPQTKALFDRAEQIPGWFTRADMAALYDLARAVVRPAGAVVEVGSWKGRSAYLLATVCRERGATLHCIDTWRGYPDRSAPVFQEAEGDPNFIRHIQQNLAEFRPVLWQEWVSAGAGGAALVVLWPQISHENARGWRDGSLDLVFLDGDHDSPGFDRDVAEFLVKVRSGGVLCGHDYAQPSGDFPDIKRVVDELFPERHVQAAVWSVRVV